MEVLGCDHGQLYAHAKQPVDRDAARSFIEMVERCVDGEPLQHVLGYTSFRGLRVDVSPAVMIPRPETEEVVGVALDFIADVEAPRILDVGTGSGCIVLALKHERPDAVVTAWDVSAEALAVAQTNARQHGLEVHFDEVDLFAAAPAEHLDERIDLLVSNPPYVPDNEAETLPAVVRDYDPPEALFSGEDPFRFYRRLADLAPALCRPGAAVVFETHADYAEGVAEVVREAGLTQIQVEPDLSGRPRILTARTPSFEAEEQ
jgi:release factor glutamine methyltransferase